MVIACGYAKYEALLIEEARTVDCQGFFHSSKGGKMVTAKKPPAAD